MKGSVLIKDMGWSVHQSVRNTCVMRWVQMKLIGAVVRKEISTSSRMESCGLKWVKWKTVYSAGICLFPALTNSLGDAETRRWALHAQ